MNNTVPYQLLADMVLIFHVALVHFLVVGSVLIVAGNLCGWGWVNTLWFRLSHLATVVVVVFQAWLGALCPLTILEMRLRLKAGSPVYEGSFIAYWLQSRSSAAISQGRKALVHQVAKGQGGNVGILYRRGP